MTDTPANNGETGTDIAIGGLLPLRGADDRQLAEIKAVEAGVVAELVGSSALALVTDPSEALPLVRSEVFIETFRGPQASPEALFVLQAGFSRIVKAKARGKSSGGKPGFNFESSDSKTTIGHVGEISPEDIWGETVEEVKRKAELQTTLDGAKAQFIKTNPLGEGGIIVTNRYGGIDPSTPEETGRSLVVRILEAKKAGLLGRAKTEDFVEFGLLDPVVGGVVDKSWTKLVRSLKPTLNVMEKLPEGTSPEARQAIVGLAQDDIQAFLESNRDPLWQAALMLKDRKQTLAVVAAVMKSDDQLRKGISKIR